MAITDTNYRVAIDMTYSNGSNATTAQTNINAALATAGRAETAARSGSTVTLLIVGLTESEATSLRNALNTPWSSATRSGGRASVSRNDDTS